MLRYVENEPALLLKGKGYSILLLADLHLGFEKSLAERGVVIPSQSGILLERIKEIVKEHCVERIILLGDVKHSIARLPLHEWKDVPEFFDELLKLVKRVEVVQGNHDGDLDPLLPRGVVLHGPRGMSLRVGRLRYYLMHGHAWPLPEAFASDYIIMGHHHLVFRYRDRSGLRMKEQVWFVSRLRAQRALEAFYRAEGLKAKGDPLGFFKERYRLRPKDAKVVILPTFNHLLSGMPIDQTGGEEQIGPLFRAGAIDFDDADLYLLDGTYLGKAGMGELHLSAMGS